MFELSGVRVIECFLWESNSEGSRGMEKQFVLLEVRVIEGSSYRDFTIYNMNFKHYLKIIVTTTFIFTSRFVFHFHQTLDKKNGNRFEHVITWIRTKLSFLILRAGLMCIRGSRSYFVKNQTNVVDDFRISCDDARISWNFFIVFYCFLLFYFLKNF